mmetsp:Transcript_4951/g.14451  ORF Transcript_4951/g.14451 Transcript_4951/m.14451 type:complete len:206 (-) Transcript_4951:1540-2157(-)
MAACIRRRLAPPWLLSLPLCCRWTLPLMLVKGRPSRHSHQWCKSQQYRPRWAGWRKRPGRVRRRKAPASGRLQLRGYRLSSNARGARTTSMRAMPRLQPQCWTKGPRLSHRHSSSRLSVPQGQVVRGMSTQCSSAVEPWRSGLRHWLHWSTGSSLQRPPRPMMIRASGGSGRCWPSGSSQQTSQGPTLKTCTTSCAPRCWHREIP